MLYPHWTKGLENKWRYDSAAGAIFCRDIGINLMKTKLYIERTFVVHSLLQFIMVLNECTR